MSNPRQVKAYGHFGIRGVRKTTNIKKFLGKKRADLVVAANKFDPAWEGYKKIDLFAILKKSSGGKFTDFDQLYRSSSVQANEVQLQFRKDFQHYLHSFSGTQVVYLPGEDRTRTEVLKCIMDTDNGFLSGVLVLDDCKGYLHPRSWPQFVIDYFGGGRHMRVDIILASHGPKEVSNDFIPIGPIFFIYQTEGNWELYKEKFPAQKYAQLKETVDRVNIITSDTLQKTDDGFQYYDFETGEDKKVTDTKALQVLNSKPFTKIGEPNDWRQFYFEIVK